MDPNNHNRDAEGLQAVEGHDFPEVVSSPQSLPSGPEVYTPPPFPAHQEQHQPFLGRNEKSPGAFNGQQPNGSYFFEGHHGSQQEMQSTAPPQYGGYEEKAVESQAQPKDQRRICGMGRKLFIGLIVLLILLVIAIAVGVGVGVSVGGDSSSDDNNGISTSNSTADSKASPYQAEDKTGLALLIPSGSSTAYTYHISTSGTIVETSYDGTTASYNKNNTQLPNTVTNLTTLGSVRSNSPIAAVSYTSDSNAQVTRQLFWIDSDDLIATSTTSGTAAWPAPQNPVPSPKTFPQTKTLTAIADTDPNALDGIRLYYGSEDGFIQEIGTDFVDNVWHVWGSFPASDPSAGVGAVLVGADTHLYFRNATSGALQQRTWDNTPGAGASWLVGSSSPASAPASGSGSISVATDGAKTDYIFYQLASSSSSDSNSAASSPALLALSISSSGSSTLAVDTDSPLSLPASRLGYAFSAVWDASGGDDAGDGDVVVLSQNGTEPARLVFSSVSPGGELAWAGTLT